MHEVGEIKINKSKHEMPLAIVLFNESYWQCPLCRIAVRFCDSLMEPQQSVPWGASQGLTSQGEAPWGTEGGPTKGEYPRDWLFGSAKGEWNRNAYFIKMYKLKNCLEEKLASYSQDLSMLSCLPICSTVTDSFHQSEGVFISLLLYSVLSLLSAALSRSVKYS